MILNEHTKKINTKARKNQNRHFFYFAWHPTTDSRQNCVGPRPIFFAPCLQPLVPRLIINRQLAADNWYPATGNWQLRPSAYVCG
jgi:hypothetical protein